MPRRRPLLHVEQLGELIMPAIITWDGGAGTLNWGDGANWNTDTKPTANDDVVINQTGITIVHSTGTNVVKSVTTSAAINFSGGTLEINGDLQMNGASSFLSGGTLKNAVVKGSGGATLQLTAYDGALSGITIASGTTLDASKLLLGYNYGEARVYDGLVNNGTILLGATTGTNYGRLHFYGSQTLSGTGTVTFGGDDSNMLQSVYYAGNYATLTIASTITINGQYGTIRGYYNEDSIDLQGAVNINSGGTLILNGTWDNNGTINAAGATIWLNGFFTTPGLGNISANGATVYLAGRLDNTGNTLTLKPEWGGDWYLYSGQIVGGTLAQTGGSDLVLTAWDGSFTNVTIASGFVVDTTRVVLGYNYGEARVYGGLVNHGTILLGANTGPNYGRLHFYGSQTLSGTGTITFGVDDSNMLQSVYYSGSYATLTIAAGLTINGHYGAIRGYYDDDAINLQATVNINSGGSLILAGIWDNNGTINAAGATITLDGRFTTDGIGNFNATGAAVYMAGDLDNTGRTLTLKPEWGGDWILWYGIIRGGTITQTGGSKLRLSNQGGHLYGGITIAAGLTVDGTTAWPNYPSNENHAAVRGGLTVDGTILLGANTGNAWGGLWFDETQTLSGTGNIVFGISTNNRLIVRNHNTTLTIGSGLTIGGQTGKIDQDYGYNSIERVINHATINMNNGGSLTLAADNWVNNGSITVLNGTLTLGGSFTHSAFGNINATGSDVYLSGALTNTGNTFTLKPEWGSEWYLWGGSIIGGTVAQTGGIKLFLSNQGGQFNGTTIAAGLTVDGTTAWPNYPSNENHAAVRGGLIVDGTILLGANTGNAWGGLWFDETQTLGGTGNIVFGISTNNRLIARNHNTVLTIGSGLTISGLTGKIDQDYGYNAIERIINHATINMNSGGTLTFGSDNWANNGSITLLNGSLTFVGSFAHSALGTLNATGSDVYLNAVMTNTGNTLTLKPEWGKWVLWNGTIDGGTLTQTGGSKLRLSNQGGKLLGGVTIAAGFTLDGTTAWPYYPSNENHAAVAGGLTVNGVINLGAATGNAWGGLWFDGTQTVGGTGQIVFGNQTANGLFSRINGATVSLGSGLQIRGGYANIYGAGSYNSVELVDNASDLTVSTNGRFNFQNLTFRDTYTLDVHPTAKVGIRGDLLATMQTGQRFAQRGAIVFYGSGTAANPQRLEVISQNNGGAPANFNTNFSFSAIQLQNNTYVRLIDLTDNMAGSGTEALYVDTLIVPAGTTIDLNGIPVYARITQIAGTVLNGSITIVPDGGGLAAGIPASGKISVAGQTDDWTIPVIAGQTLLVQLNSGDGVNIPPATPVLNRGGFDILNPQGNVIATSNAATNGQYLSVRLDLLPVGGNYTIRVHSSTSLPNATGNYQITARVAFIDTAPLPLGQARTGQIESEASLDQWTFTGSANQQLRLDVLGTTAAVRFRLVGPNGWIGFTNLTSDSDPLTLPADGDYTLEVDGPAGNYSFTLNEMVPTALALGTPLTQTLAGSASAKLYQFTTTEANPLRLRLTANTGTDRLELYLRRGAPPTRKDYEARSVVDSATQVVELPLATTGTWYALVYSTKANAGSTYTLTATTSPVFARSVTPERSVAGVPTTLTLTGAGFVVGTVVELVSGSTVIPTTVSIDAFDRLSAGTNLLGAAAGTYDVRVRRPDGATDTLAGAFTVTAAGQAKLETSLVLPGAFGRHATATITLEYKNTGNAAMPAPILVVQSGDADGSDRPLLTLNKDNLTQGFWTSATPDGFSNSVQIYASGAQPGVLLPGEVVQVPIYYAGLQQPWDFSDGQVEWEVRVHEAGNTEAVDWNSLKPTLKPTGMNEATWDAIFQNLQQQIGTTWGDYVRRLGELATTLQRLGRTVTNVADLFAFQSLMANGLPVTRVLAAAVDGAVPSAGLTVAFGRSFGNTIAERYAVGPFGRGWSMGWNVYAETLADGTVIVHESADRQRRYQPDSRSTVKFFSQEGDTATLTKLSGGALQLKDADGSVLRFLPNGQLDYIQDVNNNRINAGYTSGRLTSLTHTAGGSLLITYNAAGRITSLAESTGDITTFTYDSTNEYLLSVTNPRGTVVYTYDTGTNLAKRHALTSVTDPNGVTTTFAYDNFGRLTTSEQNGSQQRTTFAYDANGRVTITDAANTTTLLAYDHRGLLARSEDSAGDYVRYIYDADGFLRTQTDSLGRTQTYAWCGCGSLLSVTDPLGATTSFTKGGPNNQPLSFTDAKGNRTNYEYDTAGNLTKTIYADGTSESATYTASGLLNEIKNRRGQAIQLTYNNAGQITSELRPDNTTITYTYDSQQRLATATDSTETITFTYDSADRITNIAYSNGRWLSFAYDAGGRRTQMTDHSGFITKYGYDSIGRLVILKDASDSTLVSYTYDTAGRLVRENKANGTYTVNTYDALGRIKKITNHAPDDDVNSLFDYAYDGQGRRVGLTTVDGTWTYTYDFTGQLTRAVFASTNAAIDSQDLRYEYDLLGNRTRTVLNGVTTNYASNNMNQYTTAGSKVYTYDLDGNIIAETSTAGTKTFTYDALNRLTRVDGPDGVTTYEYDMFGHRVASVVNGVRTEYLVDPFGMGDVVGEYNGTGTRQASYTRGLGLEAVNGTSGLNFYDFDALGSTSGVSGTTGGYLDRYVYEPFGGNLYRNETTTNAFEYIGQYGVTTEANGLHFMRARFYDASAGRFNSQDPMNLGGGDQNLYRYVGNTPTTFIDPQGNFALLPLGALGATIGTIIGVSSYAYDTFSKGETATWQGFLASGTTGFVTGGLTGLTGGLNGVVGVGAGVVIGAGTGALGYGLETWADPTETFSFDKLWQSVEQDTLGGMIPGISIVKKWNFGKPGYLNNILPFGKNKKHSIHLWVNGIVGDLNDRLLDWAYSGGGSIIAGIAQAIDPNEKFGAAGVGPQAFIGPNATIGYRVNFENLGSGSVPAPTTPATAPAQRVEITDQLSANLDWNSVEFTGFGYGDFVQTFDAKAPFQSVTTPMTYNGVTFNVDVEMSIDTVTGMVRVVFQSIDPESFLPPDVLTGFLPPEDGTGRGKGFITFNAKPKAGLVSGTEIRNVALIRFDGQTVIATNQIDPQDASAGTDPNKEARNTIDSAPPVAGINLLPQYSASKQFAVSWSGTDPNGSGLANYDVYYSVDGGPLQSWLNNVTDSSALFVGELGKTYGFVAIGRDRVGNEQALPVNAQAVIRVGVIPTAVDDAFAVTPNKVLKGSIAANDARGRLKLSAAVVAQPTQGTLTLLANGTFTYTPNADSTGRDFFTYKWTHSTGESNIARVELATHLVNFQVTRVNIAEKRGTGLLTVTLNSPATSELTVDYTVTPLTARDADFALAGGTLTFAVGERSKTIPFTVVNDALDEANETFQVWLTNSTGPAAIGKNRNATVTIIDDDATPTVSFREKTTRSEEGTAKVLEVFLSAPAGRPVLVTYGLLRNSTASKGTDYTWPTNNALIFAEGETSRVIPITSLDDLAEEPDETVVIRLLKATNAVIRGINTHTYTIVANDPQRTVNFQTTGTTVTEGVQTISVVVTLSSPANFPVKVSYALDPTGLTATAKRDFVFTPSTLTFKAGETQKTILIRILDDKIVEQPETFTVRFTNHVNVALGTNNAFTVTLNDNEL